MDKTNEKPNIEVFDYSTIPKFMQEHGNFCLWRLVQKPGKDKPDKIPYQVNGKRADATNPEHFSSFEDAVTAYGKGGYAGIGIGCFAPIKFCDVDDCMVDEKLDTSGKDIVNTLDSYTAALQGMAFISSLQQADKFTALWNGEIPDGKSHSEADMALAEIGVVAISSRCTDSFKGQGS